MYFLATVKTGRSSRRFLINAPKDFVAANTLQVFLTKEAGKEVPGIPASQIKLVTMTGDNIYEIK